jgi:hypothetical protein
MYPNPLNITLRNVKTFNGNEGQGFSASMYVDGQPCCSVIDDANGGCYSYHGAFDVKAQKPVPGAQQLLDKAREFCKTLPPEPFGFGMEGTYQPDLDAFLDALLTDMQEQKRLARYRKENTLFKLKSDPAGSFRPVKCLDVARVKAQLDKKYGADNYEFI